MGIFKSSTEQIRNPLPFLDENDQVAAMPSPVGYSESMNYGDEVTYYVDWLTNEESFPSLGQNTTKETSTYEWEKIDYLKERQTQQYVDVAVNAQDALADVNDYHPFPSIHPQRELILSKKSNKSNKNNNKDDSDVSDDDEYKYDDIDNDIDPYYAIYQQYKSTSAHSQHGTQHYMKHIKEIIRLHLDDLENYTLREIYQLIGHQVYLPYKSPSQRLHPNVYKQDPLKYSLEEDFSIKSYKLKNKKKTKFDKLVIDDDDYTQ